MFSIVNVSSSFEARASPQKNAELPLLRFAIRLKWSIGEMTRRYSPQGQ